MRVASTAGSATARYLLEHRIPRFAHFLLRASPRRVATRLLCGAIRRHAWTFTGSADIRIELQPRPTFVLSGCPLCRYQRAVTPLCTYYAATFEGLFQHLVDDSARVEETRCAAVSGHECHFELGFGRRPSRTAPARGHDPVTSIRGGSSPASRALESPRNPERTSTSESLSRQ
jgi:divinyl protochlorophyllide a 8-vinyl-reductase